MHIALFTHHYDPEESTPQRRWSSLVSHFIEAGHRVSVFAPPLHGTQQAGNGIVEVQRNRGKEQGRYGETIYRTKFREHDASLGSRALDQLTVATDSIWQAIKYLRKDRVDVLISTAPSLPSSIAGDIASFFLRVPHVVEMRDAWPDLIRDSNFLHRASIRRRFAAHSVKYWITRAQRRAATVVTTSARFNGVLIGRGVKRVLTIRNANWGGLPTCEEPNRAGDGALNVLYAGTVGQSQGVEHAVEAVRIAADAGTTVKLRIVGDGSALEGIREQAEKLGLDIEILGKVPFSEMPAHYAWADSLLVSLIKWTPFEWTIPSKLYEAFSVGKHITAALSGEAADLIERFRAGDVVEPSNARALADLWATLVDEPKFLQIPEEAARWVDDELAPSVLAGRYLELLEEAAGSKRGRVALARRHQQE